MTLPRARGDASCAPAARVSITCSGPPRRACRTFPRSPRERARTRATRGRSGAARARDGPGPRGKQAGGCSRLEGSKPGALAPGTHTHNGGPMAYGVAEDPALSPMTHLEAVEYPTWREQIVRAAEDNEAPPDVINLLKSLPRPRY